VECAGEPPADHLSVFDYSRRSRCDRTARLDLFGDGTPGAALINAAFKKDAKGGT